MVGDDGGKVLVYNISNMDAPHFEMAGLTPGTTYLFAAFVYNVKGQSAKILFNVTTLNLAEKRTAETRSKLGAVKNEQEATEMGDLDTVQIDPGLALLPIIAILCGVAIGLGTVGLGVILLVRGRQGNRRSSGNDSLSGSGASLGTPTTYDAVPSAASSLTRNGEHLMGMLILTIS